MNKEVKITPNGIKQAIDDLLDENKRLNNIINEKNKEIEDYSNKWCELAKAKTKSDNIINELEEWLKENYELNKKYEHPKWLTYGETLSRLQELKEKNNGNDI